MVFPQFLDAVFQLTVQHPQCFEFNGHYLATLAYHAHSGRFGTFLHDNENERMKVQQVGGRTI
jgi:hypothetical protein